MLFQLNTKIGGTSVVENKRRLKRNRPQVLVGTPGRILDLFSRGDFSGSAVEILVLDEADELLQNETFRYIIGNRSFCFKFLLFFLIFTFLCNKKFQKFFKFRIQLNNIRDGLTYHKLQTLCLSATYPSQTEAFVKSFMRPGPIMIRVKKSN